MSRYFYNLLSILCAVFFLTACTPSRSVHGNFLKPAQIERIQVGQSSQYDALSILGSPSIRASFDDSTWYYIGTRKSQQGFMDPKLEEKQIYKLVFNADKIVTDFSEIDAQTFEIPLVDRKTPTHGKGLTILQQFLGNVGRFNDQSMSQDY